MQTYTKLLSLFVAANKTSTGVELRLTPLNVYICATIFKSFKHDSRISYKLTSQKKIFGFVITINDLSSDFPNIGSIGLTGKPKHIDANIIGAKSGPLFAIIPTTLFGSQFSFCRF